MGVLRRLSFVLFIYYICNLQSVLLTFFSVMHGVYVMHAITSVQLELASLNIPFLALDIGCSKHFIVKEWRLMDRF